jgi:4-amino-4-deoxy-L-arabinose transferase-like glycosyltransferase
MSAVVAPPEMSVWSRRPEWLRDERLLTGLALLAILLVALVIRLYRLPDLMIVGGDQARDLIVVKHMIDNVEPALQGPIASVGTFHRGPAYYYLLAGAYLLSGGEPLGGALLSVGMDLAALVMVFLLARAVAGNAAGLVAASLYAVAPIVVLFARFQWNPQNMVFFGLLAVYAALRISRGDGRWLMVLAPAWLIAWQLHEPSYFLVPMLGLVLLWKWRVWLKPRIVAQAGALSAIVVLPFIAQQVRTRGEDVRAMLAYMLAAATGQKVPTTLKDGLPSAVDRVTTALNWLPRALPSPGVVNLILIALGLVGLVWLVNRSVRLRSPEAMVLLL